MTCATPAGPGEEEVAFSTVRQLGAMLRSGVVSPTELTELYLKRLDDVGRRLNAVVTITDDIARREAALAEAELRSGLDRGPLHGLPYGLKDIVSAVGAPTTWGAFAGQVFEHEATVTRRLREAGAVLAAKVATIELAGGMGYDNPNASLTGAPGNPWHTEKWTNGSSSGPSAVVGAGAVPFAIGSDTGGSILLPAAFTGTAGLRATYGRVSRAGAMTLCWTLDRLGPICRCADDCGLVLEAIAGPDPRDPTTLAEGYRYRRATARTRGFRFGVIAGACEGAEPEVRANFDKSLTVLEQIGTLTEVDMPDYPYGDVTEIVVGAEAFAAFDEFIASGRTVELSARKAHTHRLSGAVIPATDYIRAQRIRRVIADGFGKFASDYDALLAPSLGVVASGIDQDFEYMLPGAFGRPINFAGVLAGTPTVSVLNGLGREGLPTGIQFAGARLSENTVLDAAVSFEAAAGTTVHRPDGPFGVAAPISAVPNSASGSSA
jgi:aspartyl-tRNA(Asn)/glutamyl-tRNA(Gln) amidotransferase subunit A